MRNSLTTGRRGAKHLRRGQIRRRRAVALIVLVSLVAFGVWAAYAIPAETPAHVPASSALVSVGESPSSSEDVVVARLEGVDVLLPVPREASTAIAYHAVDHTGTMAFSPAGENLSGGSIGQRLAAIFAKGGGVQYYLMGEEPGDGSSSTAGLDVGAVPGSIVVSPVSGKVVAVKKYSILGRYPDVEVQVQLADDPSLLLIITHLAEPRVQMGDTVTAGHSAIGVLRGFPATLDQALSRYTSDAGDHVQLVALRVTPDLAGP